MTLTADAETRQAGGAACVRRIGGTVRRTKLLVSVSVSALLAGLACGSGDRVASVGGREVTRAEFEAYLKYKNLAGSEEQQARAALSQYAERTALATAIESTDLLDETALKVELEEFRKELLISRYFEQYLRSQVSDQAVLNYYNGNPARYEEERVHAAHILLRTRRDMDQAERQVKLTTAQDTHAKLMAGGDFAALAAERSEDQVSGKRGGDLGWLKRGAVSQVFTEKVFSLKEGEVSEPFETPFGYHIVKIVEKPQTVRQPFESVKGDIRYQLRSQAKDAEVKRMLAEVAIEIADGQKLASARPTAPGSVPVAPAPAVPAAPIPGTPEGTVPGQQNPRPPELVDGSGAPPAGEAVAARPGEEVAPAAAPVTAAPAPAAAPTTPPVAAGPVSPVPPAAKPETKPAAKPAAQNRRGAGSREARDRSTRRGGARSEETARP
jgi:peptidyl-prolyl cis-trans isomerase C